MNDSSHFVFFQQYSACLIQYKHDYFGGFDVDKVAEELKRGKPLVRTVKLFCFGFFGDFRCGALLFMVILVIHKYKNR